MEQNKELFLEICRTQIHREGIDELLAWLIETDLFTAPASTRFHGDHEGGLVEHLLNVYRCLKARVAADELCGVSEESVAIVALFHDLCKVNFYKKGSRNVKVDGVWVSKDVFEIDEKFPCGDHADKSVIILQNFIKLLPEEILAIRAHMGAFDSAVKGGSWFIDRIFERSRFAVHTHLADMEATYLMEESNAR